METIKTAIQERIWGSPPGDEPPKSQDQEPMSGVKGEGTATDPYDAGNATEQPGNPVEGKSESSAIRQAPPPSGTTAAEPNGFETGSPENTGINDHDNKAVTPGETPGPSSTSTAPDPFPGETPGSGRERSHNVTEEPQDLQDQTSPGSKDDAIDPAGVPGHSPTLTHDEAADLETNLAAPQGISPPTTEPKQEEPESEDKDSEKPIPQERNYKSSGFAAEGGDFDAAASGAGKEADRLKETHEIPTTAPREEQRQQHHGGLWRGSHKAGITLEKAKEKLHIGRKNGKNGKNGAKATEQA